MVAQSITAEGMAQVASTLDDDALKQPPSLTTLINLLADDMTQVNETIMARMTSDVPLIPQLAGHLIASGGKRMRPLMTLAGARIASPNATSCSAAAIKLATAVEFIHSATLLHDDVIDESNMRRGQDTANALWGNDASVLVGDFLFARAFELMVESGNIDVLGTLSSASARITEAEIKQMTIAGNPDTRLEDYLDVIEGKTAILFAAAAASGAKISGADEHVTTAMHNYGLNLGLAFQIMDDALDYSADSAQMGKNAGDDFLDQKITLPVILAYQKANDEERGFWHRTMGDGNFAADDFAKAQGILAHHHAIEESLDTATSYAHKAKVALSIFDTPEQAELAHALREAAAFAAFRRT
ncbi:polyprenyl synthetase family protein [Candidatus Puniceispirillum sp.]|uniref:polyprenyl synthetase family protein n=1 Tax=Candidatus Puniceispirillum sp. TaxID=2026719 RepID=UPI003F697116